jgi:hypothetical protein
MSKLKDIKYVPSHKTNVLETLKRIGWTPPSEDLRFQEKWQHSRLASIFNKKAK